MRENIIANRAKLHKFFYGMFEKYDDFSKCMDATTSNFGTMILDNTSKSNEIEECIFWYRADLNTPEFRLGRSIFWKLDETYKKKATSLSNDEIMEDIAHLDMNPEKNCKRITVVQTIDESGNPVK